MSPQKNCPTPATGLTILNTNHSLMPSFQQQLNSVSSTSSATVVPALHIPSTSAAGASNPVATVIGPCSINSPNLFINPHTGLCSNSDASINLNSSAVTSHQQSVCGISGPITVPMGHSGSSNHNANAGTAFMDLASLFECPVCFDYALPPILQCPSGHIICSACRSKLSNCPTCRGSLDNIRNLAMEKLAASVQFPCKYYQSGCHECFQYTQKTDHEEICEYRPYSCPCPGASCKWSGPLEQVMIHLLNQHKSITTLQGEDIVFLATDINLPGAVDWVMMQSCFGQNFMLVLEKQDRHIIVNNGGPGGLLGVAHQSGGQADSQSAGSQGANTATVGPFGANGGPAMGSSLLAVQQQQQQRLDSSGSSVVGGSLAGNSSSGVSSQTAASSSSSNVGPQQTTTQQIQQFYAIVQLIGTRKQAEQFAYRLELNSVRRRLTWEATPRSIHDGVQAAITNSDCLVFDSNVANLFSENGNLGINVTINQQNNVQQSQT